jgi:hypothetical protein
MTDSGLLRKFLGVQFHQVDHSVLLHQEDYIQTLLSEYDMLRTPPMYVPISDSVRLSKDTRTAPVDARYYQRLVGELNYLMKTRWDIGFAVSLLSRYMHRPQKTHLAVAFSVLQYLHRHPSLGLWYPKGEDITLQGFSDVDYAGDIDDRISTSAYLFTMGGSPISWRSKKQTVTSRSSCESEYRALAKMTCEVVWLRRLIKQLGFWNGKPTTIWCDNQSSIKVTKNPMFHDRIKHFEVDLHFTRQKVKDKTIKIEYVHTSNQLADLLTKALGRVKFESCRNKLNMKTVEQVTYYKKL